MGMGSSLSLRDGRQFSLLILIEFKQTNKLLFCLKSSKKLQSSDDFRGKKVD